MRLLDFDEPEEQILQKVFPAPENFYAAWRKPCLTPAVLRDEKGQPAERLLQAVWQHQRLRRDRLVTADGKKVRIFHPGFVSLEGGPDFGNAVMQIGDEAARTGDVEIDLHPGNWRAHGHDRNPDYQNVILHVVWETAKTAVDVNAPTVLPLNDSLDAPLAELSLSLENEPLRSLPENLRGKCAAPLRELSGTQLAALLQAAAETRLQNKAGAMLARARNSNWDQALWDNLFRALGYKHNAWPMLHLAETKSRWLRGGKSAFEIQARLLGLSGLLPGELTRKQKSADTFLRHAWDIWWRERDEYENCILPHAAWKFHGLRPANHPQRRLALAAHWLADMNLVEKIKSWGTAKLPHPKSRDLLHKIFQVGRDDYWSWHWTVKSARMSKPQPLLGAARVTDLAVNVVLPWLWIRAQAGGDEKLRREMEDRFFAWPAAEDNSVLKLARQRLLGTGKTPAFPTAAAQQGLMQIVRDYCEHSNALCVNCRFPGLVRGWKAAAT